MSAITIGLAAGGASGAVASPGPAITHQAKPHQAPASSGAVLPRTTPKLPAGTREACPMPTRLREEQCQLIVHSSKTSSSATSAAPVSGAYGPTDLQAAYNLAAAASANGTGTTVAITDAYADPTLASDLAAFRTQYKLPACNSTGPGCLTVLNQTGSASLSGVPVDPTGGWELEQSLDVDMVSAICPQCSIVMYEANSTSLTDLGAAVNSAASAGHKFISNSWSGFDFPGESFLDAQYFNHPGVAIAFASGDFGYLTGVPGSGPGYPASSELVTSVGGTYLTMSGANPNTRVSETAWTETGSGCSAGEPKPAWQTDTGCANRTENDVAAVADGPNGISIYDTFQATATNGMNCGTSGDNWCAVGGTSAATAIITSVYALAGTPAANTYPSQYLYQNQSFASAGFNRVTSGSNGTCESNRLYLCNAADSLSNGYNGPTGWGTPNGVTGFTAPAAETVSVVNPGAYDLLAGATYTLPAIPAVDSVSGQTLTYSASGLPSGLSIDSATGAISGQLPATPAVSPVTVTATNAATSVATSVKFNIVSVASLDTPTTYHPGTGPVHLDLGGKCMDDTGNSSTNGSKIQIWTCNGLASQNWTYYPDQDPGDAGLVTHNGKCLDIVNGGTANGSKLQLWTCNNNPQQQWYIAGADGELINPASGRCAEDPYSSTTNGRQLDIWDCNLGTNQAWTLPASPVQSGVSGMCLDDKADGSANGTVVESWGCNGQASQRWTISLLGQLEINGKCLDATGYGTLNGTVMQLYTCNNAPTVLNQIWVVAGGELENVNAEKCLAIPGDSTTAGTRLTLQDCTGNPGEIWAES